MSDLNRKQFEKWFDESGFYKFKETAWAAWEASRECLVIELPKEENYVQSSETAMFFLLEDVRETIHAAGVKTK